MPGSQRVGESRAWQLERDYDAIKQKKSLELASDRREKDWQTTEAEARVQRVRRKRAGKGRVNNYAQQELGLILQVHPSRLMMHIRVFKAIFILHQRLFVLQLHILDDLSQNVATDPKARC